MTLTPDADTQTAIIDDNGHLHREDYANISVWNFYPQGYPVDFKIHRDRPKKERRDLWGRA